jgi:SNF2 family DNA or RNA helicase
MEYTPGMRVLIRGEEWIVRKTEINSLGNPALHCVGVSKLVEGREAIFLSDLEDIEIVDPAKVKLVQDTSPNFRSSQLYIESQWRQQVPCDTKLHIGYKACMNPLPYQLEPALMALKKTRQRILIADNVGLGKTLEAGILMSELIARGKGRRILVVTVNSMLTQFQKEMWNRFTIPLVRLDSAKIQKIRAKLPSNYNPFFYYDKTIISVDTLKRDVEYRTHLEHAYWDIIVIDEAQNVARRGSHQAQRSRLATLLADRSDAMIMLSATPHDGHAESFASLMNMLDPTAIANPKDYTADDIKGLFIRRFKKDVKDQVSGTFPERVVTQEYCPPSEAEERAYTIFANMNLQMDMNKTKGSGQLFKTSLEKALFSSPAACIMTIKHRLAKLRKKYGQTPMPDIATLEEFKAALEKITVKDFSRYQKLLSILNNKEYGWKKTDTYDRIVIFTERIDTMIFLAEQLREDLHMTDRQIVDVSGQMNDQDLQKIVEDFGRSESPIRILVASNVASEGINLHYLCHRLIHFDIPWSLMAFQQRNGRIDRYGQTQQPDIRYLIGTSKNKTVKGDLRNLEILVTKEENAQKNIGDPGLLMGKFDKEKEEEIISGAMERHDDENAFSNLMKDDADSFNPLEALLAAGADDKATVNLVMETVDDQTLFTDKNYLNLALQYFGRDTQQPVQELSGADGLDVGITDEMRNRLRAVMPEEAVPEGNHLLVSPDATYCMKEMADSMQRNMEVKAWPAVQYLWKLHPILGWVNDKAGLLYPRNEVPVLGIKPDTSGRLTKGQIVYIINGSYPNRKSTPLIDDWFGVVFNNEKFETIWTMEETVKNTRLSRTDIVNASKLTAEQIEDATQLLPLVIEKAKAFLNGDYTTYKEKTNSLLNEELDKLSTLEKKHKDVQLSLFENNNKQENEIRRIDKLFSRFVDWVTDTLTIEDKPYIRIIAVLMGV